MWPFRRTSVFEARKENVRVRMGEWFVCENGHRYAQALDDIKFGEVDYTNKIGNWKIPEPKLGEVGTKCHCGGFILKNDFGPVTERLHEEFKKKGVL
jgi:hypothetical protein